MFYKSEGIEYENKIQILMENSQIMDKEMIMEKLQEIFREVFMNDDIEITRYTVAEDIEEWDSIAHVELTSRIQEVFGIILGGKEIMSWDDVGEMVDAIQQKMK